MHFPHNDPLVLTVQLANVRVHQVLVDNGSSVDILHRPALEKMGLSIRHLKPCNSSLYRFTGDSIQPLGAIELALTMGEQPRQTTIMANFVVVDCASAFNAVLGRPSLRELKAITSVYHLAMKFLTPGGVACMKGEQKEARECYNMSLRTATKPSVPMEMVVYEGATPRVTEHLEMLPVRLRHSVQRGSMFSLFLVMLA